MTVAQLASQQANRIYWKIYSAQPFIENEWLHHPLMFDATLWFLAALKGRKTPAAGGARRYTKGLKSSATSYPSFVVILCSLQLHNGNTHLSPVVFAVVGV